MPMTRSQLRSKSSAKDSNVPSEGFPLSDSPVQAEGKDIINTPDPRNKPEATEEMPVLETLNPETGHDQADRFQLPEWITSQLNFDAEFKELCLNIQKTARMEARATEIRATLNQPEAQIIVNLIEELNGLEDDPLREELNSAMEKLYAANRKFNFATKLMQDFGLSAAPQTVSQALLRKTRTASPSTIPVSSPATGALGCEPVPVEHPAAGPAMAPTAGVAADLQASSPGAQAACSSGNRVEAVHGDQGSMARTKPSATSLKIVRKLAKAQKGRKVPSAKPSGKAAKVPMSLTSQSNLADSKEHSQPPLDQQNGDDLAVSNGGNAQLDLQADKMSKVQGSQSEPNEEGDDEEEISQDGSDEEKPREPVYYQEPGESSYNAQARYIKAFQEYTTKSIIYEKRSRDRAARKREHESKQPSEDLAKRSRRA